MWKGKRHIFRRPKFPMDVQRCHLEAFFQPYLTANNGILNMATLSSWLVHHLWRQPHDCHLTLFSLCLGRAPEKVDFSVNLALGSSKVAIGAISQWCSLQRTEWHVVTPIKAAFRVLNQKSLEMRSKRWRENICFSSMFACNFLKESSANGTTSEHPWLVHACCPPSLG